jgi:hypothetical protein
VVAAAAAVFAFVVLPRLRSGEAPPAPEIVARVEPEPAPEIVARVEPEPAPEIVARVEPEPARELLVEELLATTALPAVEVEHNDRPVIAVLDVLTELDELEGAG